MSNEDRFVIGDVTRIRTTMPFTAIGGAVFSPAVVLFRVRPPGSATVTYSTADAPSQVVQDGTGDYYVDVPLLAAGLWHYRVEGKDGDGNPLGADEGLLQVSRSRVLPYVVEGG